MASNNISKLKKHKLNFFLLFVIFFEFNIVLYEAFARTENISGYSTDEVIKANESVSFYFPNNIFFEISTNSRIELYLEYEDKISNHQSSITIKNNESISLNITIKTNIRNFGISQPPNTPKKGGFQLCYQNNGIIKIRSNSSIENFTIRYRKNNQFGLKSNVNYSLALFGKNQESWELVDTQEKLNGSISELYLESSLSGLESDTDYYITLFEFSEEPYNWTWLIFTILIVAVSILSIAFLISKKEYFHYLKTRTVSIEKGAHRLTLEDVLENENRNKIIDLVLNEPGIHFNELLRRTGIAAGNLVWHLDILKTYKVIGKKRVGNIIAYFAYYQKNPISNIDLKLQKSKLTLEILEMIEREPGIWNNIITKKLKVDHKTILYHIKKLIELDLLNIKKEGRKNKFFPNFDSEYFKFKNNNNKTD